MPFDRPPVPIQHPVQMLRMTLRSISRLLRSSADMRSSAELFGPAAVWPGAGLEAAVPPVPASEPGARMGGVTPDGDVFRLPPGVPGSALGWDTSRPAPDAPGLSGLARAVSRPAPGAVGLGALARDTSCPAPGVVGEDRD